MFFFFKQKTAYEMRISDWSSDVCSSDLRGRDAADPYNLLAADLILEATLPMKCDPQRRDDGQQHERRHGQQHPCQYRDWPRQRTSRIKHGRRDRKSVGSGKSGSVRVDLGGRRIIQKKKQTTKLTN